MLYNLLKVDIGKDSTDIKINTPAQSYLKETLLKCTDLDSGSPELESFIRNRESAHHLSGMRANLLRAFRFRPEATVLEVGCECGAITRYLGEKCRSVTGIESNPGNAYLAQLRTRDQDNVGIICTSLQDIHFKNKFDVIVALGLFEDDSPTGASDREPEDLIRQLADLLDNEGTLLLAADNPSGLGRLSSAEKNSFQEILEHSLEHTEPGRQDELSGMLEPHFDVIDLYFPYPEYRLAECILSDEMIRRVSVGELLGNFGLHDPDIDRNISFNERLALLELDRNNSLQYFANSFLIAAGREKHSVVRMDGLGMIFSKGRNRELQTVTRFVDAGGSGIKAVKIIAHHSLPATGRQLRLVESESDWVDGHSLQLRILRRAVQPDSDVETIFAPAKVWLKYIRSHSVREEGRFLLDGSFIDHIWKNCFPDKQRCRFIDKEWEWDSRITVNALLIRSIFLFLKDAVDMPGIPRCLTGNSTRSIITRIAQALDVKLASEDFNEYLRLEAEFQSMVYGRSRLLNLLEHKLVLWNRSAYNLLGKLAGAWKRPRKNE
ncbi:MAG: class I SAM-dependent methyltransferase [Thiogranum sp.]